jgi:tRNA(Met) C34 N-acetyltransferase TmcA
VFLTASRGRGKTVGLAFAVAGAMLLNCSTIFVSAPTVENLNIFFDYLVIALEKLGYKKNLDFNVKANHDGFTTQVEFFSVNKSDEKSNLNLYYLLIDPYINFQKKYISTQ